MQLLVSGSLGVSAAVSVGLVLQGVGFVLLVSLFGGLAVLSWFWIASRSRKGKSIEWFLSIAALNLLLAVPEISLRVAHFRYDSGIEFGYPRPHQFDTLVPDGKLFWKNDPSRPNNNSLGFRNREVVSPKPDGVYRVLFLGDSCTNQGIPRRVEQALDGRPGAPVECVNFAVHGYTSHQGRIVAEKYADLVDPDLVFVYFGWNDHWLAYRSIDSEKVVPADEGGLGRNTRTIYSNVRLLQAGLRLVHRVTSLESTRPLDEVRVPIDEYRANLSSIRELFEERGVAVVFITAPTSFYGVGVHPRLLRQSFAKDADAAIRLHRAYNDVVRDVALHLLDLEADLDGRDDLDELFLSDGIHFRATGLELVSSEVARVVERRLSEGAASSDP